MRKLLVALSLLAAPAYAQLITAALEGLVQDPSGAVVPNAKVEVVNTETNVATHLTTDAAGRFVAPSLAPGGPYTVTVETAGFKTEQRAGITLEVNQTANITITLQVGQASETVKVVADAAQLEETPSMGAVVDNHLVVNLPLNQRNPYALAFLAPGVTGTVGNAYNSSNIAMNGGRPGSTDVLVDGIPSSPPLVNPIQGFAVFPSVDAVQEFKVQTNMYSAEFGRSGSGIVNLIYKSGTNQIHGSAFEFLRNTDLDANQYFNNLHGVPLASLKRNQFGGSVGGPVDLPRLYHGQNKSFFFVAYESLRQSTATTATDAVPSTLQREGDFSQTTNGAGQKVIIYDPNTTVAQGTGYVRTPFPNNVIPTSMINPVSNNIAKYYPQADTLLGGVSGANNFYLSGATIVNSDQIDSKFDENINERNRFFVRYSYKTLAQPAARFFPVADQPAEGTNSQPQVTSAAAVDYTLTKTPTFLMDFRYGFSRVFLDWTTISDGFNPTSLGFPSYIAANADHLLFPGIAVANYVTLGNAGQGQWKRSSFQSHLFSLTNTKVLSSHLIKFGTEFRLLFVNDTEAGSSTGNFSFAAALTQGPNPNTASSTAGNAFATFLLGVGSGSLLINSKNAATKSEYDAYYFQDDWKVAHNLTINLGMRWDIDLPRTERYNAMETFTPGIASPLAGPSGISGLKGGLQFAGVDGDSRRQFQPQWSDWAPRAGFAWQAMRNMVIRGGYGVFYAPSLRSAGATIGNEGFSSSTTYTGSPNNLTPSVYISNPFPTGLNPIAGSSQGLLTGVGATFETPITGDNHVPYTQSWNFDIQRQLPQGVLIDAAYVGSHGVHLNSAGENDFQLDQLTPQALALGTKIQQSVPNPFYGLITTGPLATATVPYSYLLAPFPQYTGIEASYITGGYTLYHAFQLKVDKRFSHGLSALLSFTGQKLIDNYSIISNVGNSTGGIQNIYDRSGDKSVSSNDISKHLSIAGVYNLPFGRGQQWGMSWSPFVNAVLGGWAVNAIDTAQTGFPLSPTTANTSNSGSNALRPNNNGQDPALSGPVSKRLNGYLNAKDFSLPAAFTFGNTSRTLPNVRAPGLENIDFSLFKAFHIRERLTMQFRAEAFNLLNQVVFGTPNMTVSAAAFGTITSQSNTARQLQFALKLLF
jgi:hypothetical protein